MNKYLVISLLLSNIAISATASSPSISALHWLSGCWAAVDREAGTEEHWMAPNGGSMLGMRRTVKNSRTVAFEFMRIEQDGEGRIVFVASPSGQQTATFAMTELSDNEVTFENPEHDFPQRVIYRRLPDDGLLGRIEGTANSEVTSADFPMKRTNCGNQSR